MYLKLAVFGEFMFDWEMCYHLCEVYHFQESVGLELPIKHTLLNAGAMHSLELLRQIEKDARSRMFEIINT